MIFAIDIGNTNITIGCIDDQETYFTERISSDTKKTALEYAVILKSILEFQNITPSQIEGSIISSVVPPICQTISQAVERVLNKRPMIVGPGIKTGLSIKIENPAQLGADMVVAAVGALERYSCPMIIFDLGTATTISVIDKNRDFLGGMITPGLRAATEAMNTSTAQLPVINLEPPKKVIGRNTIECMRSGIILGNACMIDGMITRIEEELGEPATVIVTGGVARYVLPFCRKTIHYEDDLLLSGLHLIYTRNR